MRAAGDSISLIKAQCPLEGALESAAQLLIFIKRNFSF
jgi:hypothetical protein